MENTLERALLATRWMLLPLFASLLLGVVAIYGLVIREVLHAASLLVAGSDTDIVIAILNVLDLVLVANLLVMVAVSSYESYISRIDAPPGHSPEWLGKLDSSNVKVKVAVSVVMISMIHVLRAFMEGEAERRLLTLAAVHIVFVLSALGIALIDRAHRPAAAH